MKTRTVVPIPPSFDREQNLDSNSTAKYVKYLENSNVCTVMTTAGTSQYNLLETDEIHTLNNTISDTFGKNKILGVPALSTEAAKKFIKHAEENYVDKNTRLMCLYPDRFYNSETIQEYFTSLRNISSSPLYIHGMFVRSGTGGNWDFDSSTLQRLISDGIIEGMKEENSSLIKSFSFVDEVRKISDSFDIIVAGGSMRRHQFLKNAGANSFLAGLGNFFPEIEISYCRKIDSGRSVEKEINLETNLFEVFNRYGWHQSLRIGLSELQLGCLYDRQPWPDRQVNVSTEIATILKDMRGNK